MTWGQKFANINKLPGRKGKPQGGQARTESQQKKLKKVVDKVGEWW